MEKRDPRIKDTLSRLHRWCESGGIRLRESSIQDLLYYDLFQYALQYPAENIDLETWNDDRRFDIRLKPNIRASSSHLVIELKRPSLDILGKYQKKYICQASSYVLKMKASLGCVTNGYDWLFFRVVKRPRCQKQYDAEIIFKFSLGKDNSNERKVLENVLRRCRRRSLGGLQDLFTSFAKLEEDAFTEIKHNTPPVKLLKALDRRMRRRNSGSSVRYKDLDIEAIKLAFKDGAKLFSRMTEQAFVRIPIDA